MKINLRQAHKLESKISQQIKQMMSSLETTGTINVWDADEFSPSNDPIALKQSELTVAVAAAVGLIGVRYNIREAISQANASAGIDDIILLRKMTQDIANVYQQVAVESRDESVVSSLVGLSKQIQSARAGESATLYRRENVVRFSALTQDARASFKDQLSQMHNKIEKYEEQLIALNINTTITISDDAVQVLKDLRLI